MESLKRSLYIALSVLIVIFLIKFMFSIAIYLIPIILIIIAIKKIKNLVKIKKSDKEYVSKSNDVEVSIEDDVFSVENAIEVEYEEIDDK